MRSMRKLLVNLAAFILSVVCVFTFCACGANSVDPTGGVTLTQKPGPSVTEDGNGVAGESEEAELEGSNFETTGATGDIDPYEGVIELDPTPATEGVEFRLNADGKSYRVFDYVGTATNVYIPYTYEGYAVTEIGYAAFKDTDIINVTIPKSVIKLGDYAFFGCASLEKIDIPAALVDIPTLAFGGCPAVSQITAEAGNTKYTAIGNCLIEVESNTLVLGCKNSVIPGTVTAIGEAAFRGCSGITTMTIPESVETIEAAAFMGCTSLTGVTLPPAVTSIADNLFDGCSALSDIVINEGVTDIGYAAFRGCTKLVAVDVPSSVVALGDYSFAGCSKLVSVTTHEGSMTYLGGAAFKDCELLSGTVEVPSTVRTLGANAFEGCKSISTVKFTNRYTYNSDGSVKAFENDLETIKAAAFYGCTSLTFVNIPQNVKYVGHYAFYGCVSDSLHVYVQSPVVSVKWELTWNNGGPSDKSKIHNYSATYLTDSFRTYWYFGGEDGITPTLW